MLGAAEMFGENQSLGTTGMLPSLAPVSLEKQFLFLLLVPTSVYTPAPSVFYLPVQILTSPLLHNSGKPAFPGFFLPGLRNPFGIHSLEPGRYNTQVLLSNCSMGLSLMASCKQGVGPVASILMGDKCGNEKSLELDLENSSA